MLAPVQPTTPWMSSNTSSLSSSHMATSPCWKWARKRSTATLFTTVPSWRLQNKQLRWTKSKAIQYWGMIRQITERSLPRATSALTMRRSKSSDQMAPSTSVTSPITSSWTRRLTLSSQPSSTKGVRSALTLGTASKKSLLPVNNALATSSTSRVRIKGQVECQDLPTSVGTCLTSKECPTSARCHHTSCKCLSGTTWKWWGITQVMVKSSPHIINLWHQRGAIVHTHKVSNTLKTLALTASKSATAHWSMETWTCHHLLLHQVNSSGHTCQAACTKTAKAMTSITRDSASFLHCKTARRSGGTTTARWTTQMSMEVHQDHSISSPQTKSRTLIILGLSIIITKARINRQLLRQWRAEMLEWHLTKTTDTPVTV